MSVSLCLYCLLKAVGLKYRAANYSLTARKGALLVQKNSSWVSEVNRTGFWPSVLYFSPLSLNCLVPAHAHLWISKQHIRPMTNNSHIAKRRHRPKHTSSAHISVSDIFSTLGFWNKRRKSVLLIKMFALKGMLAVLSFQQTEFTNLGWIRTRRCFSIFI